VQLRKVWNKQLSTILKQLFYLHAGEGDDLVCNYTKIKFSVWRGFEPGTTVFWYPKIASALSARPPGSAPCKIQVRISYVRTRLNFNLFLNEQLTAESSCSSTVCVTALLRWLPVLELLSKIRMRLGGSCHGEALRRCGHEHLDVQSFRIFTTLNSRYFLHTVTYRSIAR
jgi:hypothetical protein